MVLVSDNLISSFEEPLSLMIFNFFYVTLITCQNFYLSNI